MKSLNFKVKKSKIINNKISQTVDKKHNEMMQKFKKNDKILETLIKKKTKLRSHIANSKSMTDELTLNDDLSIIKDKIRAIKKEKKNYFLNNSKELYKYFETKKDESHQGINKVTIVNSFFSKTKTAKHNEFNSGAQNNSFLAKLDNTLMNINNYTYNSNICKCGGELIPVQYEGVKICNKCGLQKKYIIEHEKNNYNEAPKEVCFYAYKRINHFKEILAQFQAKETTQISNEILENIKLQITKERLTLDHLTNAKCKDILNKLGYNKYYEHISFIKDKLGIKPPVMSQELEEKLCSLFIEIEKQYAKHCPNNRVNFLNYYYVLYKLCELLNETYFLPYFPMLKDPVKRIEQDVIWKKICEELGWKFIPII
jgi:hypothetical protein